MQDRVANSARYAHLAKRFAIPPAVGVKDVAAIERVAQHLLEDEWIPLAALVEEITELIAHVRLFKDRADDVGDFCRFECLQLDQVHLA